MRVPVVHMAHVLGSAVLWIVAAFYAWGAAVHVMNMAGLSGFDWSDAPLRWRVLDVVYLVLGLAVAGGLPRRRPWGIGAFYVASLSQLALYTLGRDWVLDVPEGAMSADEVAASGGYVEGLLIFHAVALVLVTIALRAGLRRGA